MKAAEVSVIEREAYSECDDVYIPDNKHVKKVKILKEHQTLTNYIYNKSELIWWSTKGFDLFKVWLKFQGEIMDECEVV